MLSIRGSVVEASSLRRGAASLPAARGGMSLPQKKRTGEAVLQKLFTLHYDLPDGHRLILHAFDTGREDERGTARIEILAKVCGDTLWSPGDTYCHPAPGWALDGPETKKLVTELVALKPGDTDSEYFASYTPARIAFAVKFGEHLQCEAEARYGEG